jgi:DivIVA domain-containing protein
VTWLFTLLAMTVIAVVAGVVTGRIGGGGMDAPASSLPFRGLPGEDVAPGDLETLRFSPALRGYRMDEVDQVLDRLGSELRRRDDEIARLRERLAGQPESFSEPHPADHQATPSGPEWSAPERSEPERPERLGPEPADAESAGRQLPGRS